MPVPVRALAIMHAFNEEDVIAASIGALVEQGVDVYLLDNHSTDGTVAAAAPFIGRGLVAIETFPGTGAAGADRMELGALLRRVQGIMETLDYEWFLINDADEFREAPWPGLTLPQGLARAQALGYDAINFRVLDFRPVDDRFVPGGDPRAALTGFELGQLCDAPQMKAFRRPDGPFSILTHGGHEVEFAGRRVCPIPFILRHYPIRSPEHGRRKVLRERLPRFAPEERAKGWHVQYDALLESGREFVWAPEELHAWDPVATRLELLAEAAETLAAAQLTRGAGAGGFRLEEPATRAWVEGRLGADVDDALYAEARTLLVRVLKGGDATGAEAPAIAPVVITLLDALATQASAAGEVMQGAGIARHRGALADAARAALPRWPLEGARSTVVLASAEEMVAGDALATFCAAVTARDDVTLALHAPGWPEERIARELGGALRRVGTPEDELPDLLVVADAPLAGFLATTVDAVLTAHPVRDPLLESVPVVAPRDAGRLVAAGA